MNTQTPIFILSSGRTGSTFLAKMLNRHPEMLIVSDLFEPVGEEPYFDADRELTGQEFWDILKSPSFPQRIKSWRKQANAELLFLHPDDEMVSLLLSYTIPFVTDKPMELFDKLEGLVCKFEKDLMPKQLLRFFDLLRDLYSKKIWVERTGGSLPHAKKILELWPNAKIVHNYRDPREIAISMLKGSFFRLYFELEKDSNLGEWDESYFPPVEALGAMINRWFVDAMDALADFKGPKIDFSYEALMSAPKENLLKLSTFFLERPPNDMDLQWAATEAEKIRPARLRFPSLENDVQERLETSVKESLLLLNYKLQK